MNDEEQPTAFEKKVRMPAADIGENPHRIPVPDPLLQQLLAVHPDRRYEELSLKK
jgi:hypothetical protein